MRMRNDVDVEEGAAYLVDGQTHAIDANGALRRNEARERARHLEAQTPGARIGMNFHELADGVDMSADEMAAERIAGPQARLQIHARTADQRAQCRLGHCFARHIGEKHPRLLARHGQACALHAHAVAERDAREIEVRRIESQFEIAFFLGDRNECPGHHDDSGKHTQAFFFGFKMRRTSAPMRRTSSNSKPRVIASRPLACGARPSESVACTSAPRKSASGSASTPRKIGATYSNSSSTSPARRNAAAKRGPHSTSTSLTSNAVKRRNTASRSKPPSRHATRSTRNADAGASGAANT